MVIHDRPETRARPDAGSPCPAGERDGRLALACRSASSSKYRCSPIATSSHVILCSLRRKLRHHCGAANVSDSSSHSQRTSCRIANWSEMCGGQSQMRPCIIGVAAQWSLCSRDAIRCNYFGIGVVDFLRIAVRGHWRMRSSDGIFGRQRHCVKYLSQYRAARAGPSCARTPTTAMPTTTIMHTSQPGLEQ